MMRLMTTAVTGTRIQTFKFLFHMENMIHRRGYPVNDTLGIQPDHNNQDAGWNQQTYFSAVQIFNTAMRLI